MGRVQPLDGHHKYDKISDLGEGAFGFVQLARNKHTGEHVAIKFLPRGPDVPPPPPPSLHKQSWPPPNEIPGFCLEKTPNREMVHYNFLPTDQEYCNSWGCPHPLSLEWL